MFVPKTAPRRGECMTRERMGSMRLVVPIGLLLVGCAFEAPPAGPPSPDRVMFDAEVYPVLLRDCGFPDCHGNPDRFFRLYGPGRTRLGVARLRDAPTRDEMTASYERARSMLASAARAEDALLLRKPLEIDRGGAAHQGIDEHGQDVYRSTESEGYRLLLRWARTGIREGS